MSSKSYLNCCLRRNGEKKRFCFAKEKKSISRLSWVCLHPFSALVDASIKYPEWSTAISRYYLNVCFFSRTSDVFLLTSIGENGWLVTLSMKESYVERRELWFLDFLCQVEAYKLTVWSQSPLQTHDVCQYGWSLECYLWSWYFSQCFQKVIEDVRWFAQLGVYPEPWLKS